MIEKQVTQFFNCKSDPPHYTGWYDFKFNGGVRRVHYSNIHDSWCDNEYHLPIHSSPSKVLAHCEWRGIFGYPGEGFTCEDMD